MSEKEKHMDELKTKTNEKARSPPRQVILTPILLPGFPRHQFWRTETVARDLEQFFLSHGGRGKQVQHQCVNTGCKSGIGSLCRSTQRWTHILPKWRTYFALMEEIFLCFLVQCLRAFSMIAHCRVACSFSLPFGDVLTEGTFWRHPLDITALWLSVRF